MKLDDSHLCYSLNVFPATNNLKKRFDKIGSNFNFIRKELDLDKSTPFALGLWADNVFTTQMKDEKNLKFVKNFLSENNFYTFTVNAFPYDIFHDTPVKEKVYTPDWTTATRTNFTCEVADFLSQLLPDNIVGSISTLPGGYKQKLSTLDKKYINTIISENLLKVATHLEYLHKKHGTEIILSIEMEPDCLWESSEEFIEFYNNYLKDKNVARKYIGVCYDTCHQELVSGKSASGIKKLIDNNIKIGKIQLSAALKTEGTTELDIIALQKFKDEIYLHQTRIKNSNNTILNKFTDIPLIATDKIDCYKNSYLISHFHLPIFTENIFPKISSAKNELLEIIKIIKNNPNISNNLEIETYTYNVLPKDFSTKSIEYNIAEEYKWILKLWHSM